MTSQDLIRVSYIMYGLSCHYYTMSGFWTLHYNGAVVRTKS